MSYLLGQMEATRIIGECLRATGQHVVLKDVTTANVLFGMGSSLIDAADRMQQKMRDETGEGRRED